MLWSRAGTLIASVVLLVESVFAAGALLACASHGVGLVFHVEDLEIFSQTKRSLSYFQKRKTATSQDSNKRLASTMGHVDVCHRWFPLFNGQITILTCSNPFREKSLKKILPRSFLIIYQDSLNFERNLKWSIRSLRNIVSFNHSTDTNLNQRFGITRLTSLYSTLMGLERTGAL